VRYLKFFMLFALDFLLIGGTVRAAEYAAFSLKVAQERITKVPEEQYSPEVFSLGGITALTGLVYDRVTGDVILIGEKNPERALLTLDDFVVALRARFIHGKWPLVSIDPTEETKKTEMQVVRFEGGIEETQFGQDLFDADYRLKRIGMGLLPPGIPGLETYWNLGMEEAKKGTGGSRKISSRFWFYPVLPSVSVREDVVAIKGLKVGVFTEVLSAEIDGKKIEDLSTFQDVTGDQFAKAVSERYEELTKVHPSFLRLQGLDELVALTKAIEEMDEKPDLSFWLENYRVKKAETKKEVKVLKRKQDYELPVSGGVYSGYLELSGGVELTAIALRLKSGDVTALKEAVLHTRPKPDALSWSFVAAEWLIPTSPEMFRMDDIVALFTQALFLQEKKYHRDAIVLYGKIIEFKPDWNWPYHNRGLAYADMGEYDKAISDYNKAIEIDPMDAGVYKAYLNRGNAYDSKGEYNQAISDYNKALEINPEYAEGYNNRGLAYANRGEYNQAISDYNKALEIKPEYAEAYANRGNAYCYQGEYDLAIPDYNKTIELNARLAGAYYNRGLAYALKGQYDQAISDCSKELEINPRDARAYITRGISYADKGEYDQAMSDYNKALEIDPIRAEPYINRGNAHANRGEYVLAIHDYNRALEIDPGLPKVYYGRGLAYAEKGDYDQAISDHSKAIEINPKFAEAYNDRGLAYARKGEYDQAISDYNKALEIKPEFASAFNNRGSAYFYKGEYDRAISDYNKALEINQTDAWAWFNKALACEKAGRSQEAAQAYKSFIQNAPSQYAPQIEHARQRIKELEGR
jgi:tetratricopeptide (TPR) repeat protein